MDEQTIEIESSLESIESSLDSSKIVKKQRMNRKGIKRKFVQEECDKGHQIVFDLSFDSVQTDRELSSVRTQITTSYSTNTNSSNPFRLHLTSLFGRMLDCLNEQEGFESWVGVSKHSEHFLEVFDHSKIVYLTPDSDTPLETLDRNRVFVIGAICDTKRIKVCLFNL